MPCPFPPRSTDAVAQLEEQKETLDAYDRSNLDFREKRDKRKELAEKGIDAPQDIEAIKGEEDSAMFQELTLRPALMKKSFMKTVKKKEPREDPAELRIPGKNFPTYTPQNFAVVNVLCHRLFKDPKLKGKYGEKEMRYLFNIVHITDTEENALLLAEESNKKNPDYDFTIVEMWDWAPFPPPPGGIRYMYRDTEDMQERMDHLYGTLEKRGHYVAGPTKWMEEKNERISNLMMDLPTPEEMEEESRKRIKESELKKEIQGSAEGVVKVSE